ncbi:16S rRNA (uracil(1498)-N(3))-methyltransferase [Anaerosalibacter bizertensis]|uniref:Ribosomal RNA small subunit methyltransferase E n=1 Tax=Anaerosalibacter bizertensis TaxID=932217 RepID=A0A844FI10_9FIRM|nr:16S rRNA (uracil(1498)-N(3))-methyltransferase [Anaerosalibacter bizertensis]MBV1817870.1 16S rRNA (uracil(1498)-N(3))-methyltransferase [Bacteroidales bacterium MSK.15.36]HHV27537.1 16S rRNA (uracil(1498)-N(3))-methyltransferase [Tissierellia bacterium]MCB5559291.1 16S rRNA (uracil(1498)-N(3))-methyltransferase [Anaerosalibacter bizertensis]MCG4565037.1 16S rRNA (uracil(1498)-N(3))-methyltransferase [Anaerosalibacter bizertensis]MCG4582026.1 16S rRNA (uracil(1498)-N(3))-methyltransferase [
MNRFFIDKENISEELITIEGEDVKHIRDVIRLKEGDKIEISSEGILYICEISIIEKKKVIAKILHRESGDHEPPISIILYQGLPKSSKMDFIIQKATEIGVKEIYPIKTKRTVVKIDNKKKEKNKIDRWNKISEEAAKQSKRDYVPKVKSILSFKEMIKLLEDEENILVPYENEKTTSMKDVLKDFSNKKVHIIIGPEGGFEEEEIDELEDIGSKIVSLGPRILRTETAGLVALSILLYELGDM